MIAGINGSVPPYVLGRFNYCAYSSARTELFADRLSVDKPQNAAATELESR
jgi:hypothetical protein